MCTTYTISNRISGLVLGTYKAMSRTEALDLMAIDAGYTDYNHMLDVTGDCESELRITVSRGGE